MEYGVKTENKFSFVNTLHIEDDETVDPSEILRKLEESRLKNEKTAKISKLTMASTNKKKTVAMATVKGPASLNSSKSEKTTSRTKEDKENKSSGPVDFAQKRSQPGGMGQNNSQRGSRAERPPRFRQSQDQPFQNNEFEQQNEGKINEQIGNTEITGFGTGFKTDAEQNNASGYRQRGTFPRGAGQRRFQNGGRGAARGGGDGFRGRQFDRQSGSDKTGVKAVEKRDGAGSHNWGSTHQNQELEAEQEIMETQQENEEKEEKPEKNGDHVAAEPDQQEQETLQLTLDEWRAKQAPRVEPKFNVRRAGEGEKNAEWKKLVPLKGDEDGKKKKKKSKKEVEIVEEEEVEDEEEDERSRKLLPVEIRFSEPASRGGRGRFRGTPSRGRGGGFGREGRNFTKDGNSLPDMLDNEAFPSLS